MSSDLLIRYGGPFAPGLVKSASGSFIEMEDGSRVLDFTAGQICATIGHNHPRVVEAIERSCRDVMHLNSWSLSPPVISLAERLDRHAARAARARDVPLHRRRGERGRAADGEARRAASSRWWRSLAAGTA